MKDFFIFFSLIILLASCKKDDPNPSELPPETQEGKNTFGCYINGEIWVPYAPQLLAQKIIVVVGNGIVVEASRFYEETSNSDVIKLFVVRETASNDNIYQIPSKAGVSFHSRKEGCRYYSDSDDSVKGFIKITKYSLEEKILAGTFEFTLEAEDCQTLHFTDGRFDVRLP